MQACNESLHGTVVAGSDMWLLLDKIRMLCIYIITVGEITILQLVISYFNLTSVSNEINYTILAWWWRQQVPWKSLYIWASHHRRLYSEYSLVWCPPTPHILCWTLVCLHLCPFAAFNGCSKVWSLLASQVTAKALHCGIGLLVSVLADVVEIVEWVELSRPCL